MTIPLAGTGGCDFDFSGDRRFELLPADLASAHAMIVAERAARIAAQAELTDARAEAANAQADLTSSEALIAHLKLAIEKLRRELYGTRSERKARLLDQMELKLEELEAAASEDERAAQQASTEAVRSFERRRTYDPEFRLLDRIQPFIARAMSDRYQPAEVVNFWHPDILVEVAVEAYRREPALP